MKYIKKIISFILILCLIFNTDIFAAISNFVTATKSDQLPEGVYRYNQDGYALNMTLFKQKNIIVYGTYEDVKKNDFKEGSIKPGEANNDNIKYGANNCTYIKGTQYGEYRYHGYDYDGNKYVNENFPVDKEMRKSADQYKWIYRIWDSKSPYNYGNQADAISQYNLVAIYGDESRPTEQIKMQEIINKSAPFKIITPIGSTDTNFFNYAHVYSIPTRYSYAQYLVHHYSDQLHYAVFSSDKKPEKLNNNVVVDKIEESDIVPIDEKKL